METVSYTVIDKRPGYEIMCVHELFPQTSNMLYVTRNKDYI